MAGVALSWWWTAPADVLAIHATILPGLVGLTWLAGRMARGQRAREDRLHALVTQLEAERATGARVAVLAERARMARELHDAIAQAVSQMVVQAAAAEAVLATGAARAARPLRAVQETGRDAITELRRLLGILRSDGGEAPPPGIRRSDAGWAAAAGRPRRPPTDVPPRRAGPRWPWWLDPLLAVLCAAAIELEVATAARYAEHRWVSALFVLVAILPLAVRRRYPLAVLLTVVAATAAQQIVADWEGHEAVRLVIGPLVALYTVGAHAPRRHAIAGAAVTVLVALGAEYVVMGLSPRAVGGWAAFVAVPLLSGAAVQARRRQAERLHTLALRLAREQAARARLAVMEERARMARDLHDEVAHGVSVMVLQAGAAEQVLATAPEQARAATRGDPGHRPDRARRAAAAARRAAQRRGGEPAQPRRRPRPARRADRRRPAGGPAGRAARRGHARPAGRGPRRLGVPRGAGGADERAQARRPGRRPRSRCASSPAPSRSRSSTPPAAAAAGRARAATGCVGMRERVALYGGELRGRPAARAGATPSAPASRSQGRGA